MLRLVLIATLLGLVVAEARPRVAIVTDGSREQRCSLVRLLLYLDGLELESLFYQGDATWIEEKLSFYAQCQLRLQENAPTFPEAGQLRAVVREAKVPALVEQLLAPSKERLHLLVWAGADEVIAALTQIEGQKAIVSKRTSIHLLGEPKESVLAALKQWPDLEVIITETQRAVLGPDWKDRLEDGSYKDVLRSAWIAKNVLQSHGPLCASYEAHGNDTEAPYLAGDFYAESPSLTFLRLVPNGLGSQIDPSYGGWGGRYERRPGYKNVWQDPTADKEPLKSVWRWLTHLQGDFSARADWCVRLAERANHAPSAAVNGNVGNSVLRAKAKAGQRLSLDASASKDPDEQRIAKAWWHYTEASTFKDNVVMDRSLKDKIEFTVPFDTKPQTHHVMVTVRDGGTPALFAYRRLLIEAAAGVDSTPPAAAPVLSGNVEDARTISLSWPALTDPESGIRHYQVFRDGELLAGDLTEPKFVDEELPEATAFTYHVIALNGALLPSASSKNLRLATPADTVSPELNSVLVGSSQLTLTFTEKLDKESAEAPQSYAFTQNVTVAAAKLSEDGQTVTLTTSPLPLSKQPCQLSITGVQDLAATPNGVAPGTTYGFLYKDSE